MPEPQNEGMCAHKVHPYLQSNSIEFANKVIQICYWVQITG